MTEGNEKLVEDIGDAGAKLRELTRLENAPRRLGARCSNGTLDECPVIDESMQ